MGTIIFLVIYLIFLSVVLIEGFNVIRINYYNPLPKLDNGTDKPDNCINFVKTRKIK